MTEDVPVKKITLTSILAAFATILTSPKLWMTLVGISVMYGLYWHSSFWFIETAKAIPHDKATVLLPILSDAYQTVMWGIVTAVGVYLGFSTLDKFTRGTTSVAQAITNTLIEKKESKEEIIYREELERGD